MKKIYVILAITLASITAKAQEPVIFKLKFLPDHDYKANMKMAMDMQMTGLPEQKSATKSKTTKSKPANPQSMNTKVEMVMKFDIKTGAVVPANTFPVTMKYEDMSMKMTMNDKEMPSMNNNPLAHQTIYGNSDLAGKFQIDSISGIGANEQMKATMTQMVNKLQGQVNFPEHELKIGESFTQEMPISFPATGMSLDMMAKITYKLISINANLAYFDTDMTMSFGMGMQKNGGMKMTGTGGGKGKMIYNIGENYFNSMTQNMVMNYNITMADKKTVGTKMKMVTDVENVISRN